MTEYPILVLLVLAVASNGTHLAAQGAPPPRPPRQVQQRGQSVAEALAAWRGGDTEARTVIRQILRHPDRHDSAVVDSAFEGTAQLALTAPEQMVRGRAVALLMSVGDAQYDKGRRPGVVGRARTIYESSRDGVVRLIIVTAMAWQAERPEAIAFLKGVVVEGDNLTEGFDGSTVFGAIDALHRMGAAGDEALRQAYATGRMGPAAVGYLEHLEVIPRRP